MTIFSGSWEKPGGTFFGSVFTPAGLTGLIAWWDASVFASLSFSGSNVTQAVDQSGNGNNVTLLAGTGPVYSATSFNSRPGFTFSGVGNTGLGNATFPLGTGNTLTIWTVMSLVNTAVGSADFGRIMSYTRNAPPASHDFSNTGSFTLVREASTSGVDWIRNSTGPATAAYGYATPRRIICTVKSDGAMAIYVDGTPTSAAPAAANWASPGGMYLGHSLNDSGVGSGRLAGTIGEAGVATGYSDATTVAALDLYLKNKWGL